MKVSTVSILVVLMLMVSLVGASSVTAEASNVAGTVTMSKSYISATGTLTVTLTDADLNVGVAQTNEASDYAAVNYATPGTFVEGTQFNKRVKKYPILDNNADGYVNFQDVTASIAGVTAYSVAAASGIVTWIGTANAVNSATAFTVSYKAADIQTADVTVSSGQDATGFTLRLLETSATSGTFSKTFTVGPATVNTSAGNETSGGTGDMNGDGDALDTSVVRGLCVTTVSECNVRPVIAAVAGSVLSAKYTDASPAGTITGSSTVETTVPLFALVEPVTASSTQNPQVRLIATVTDADSLVDSTTIRMWIKRGSANATEHTPTITAITGGHKAEFILTSVSTGETDVQWWLKATDKAGNVGVTETNTTTACTVASFAADATGGCDGYTVRVDTVAPAFDSSTASNNITGVFWDSTKTTTDKTNTAVTAAKKDQVRVMFGENLNATTVAPSDFSVTLGTVVTTPTAAAIYAGAPKSVFLTLGTALTASQKPTIKVVGSVADTAGNSTTSGSVATADGIAPTITLTVDALSKTSVKILVSSDETLAATPTISVANQTNTAGAIGSATAHTNAALVGTNSWSLTFSTTTAPTGNNVKNIQITGTDLAGNAGVAGKALTVTAGAVTFQIDTTLPAPTILPTGNTEQTAPFVSLDFSGEGTEYIGDSSKTVTITAATLKPTGGTAVDILSALSTNDSITYIYAATGLAKGVYTVTVSAKDVATNVVTASTGTFTVVAPAAYSIALTPGWNLISLPRDAASSAIDTVISSTHPIDQVITYDPSDAALFLLSSRTGAAAFAGSLTTIVSTKAYWVHTKAFQALKVTLAEVTPQNLVPSAIKVVKGWNMIPVMSLLSTPPATIDADIYLSTIRWSKAYNWNATSRTFAGFTPGGVDTVATGSGYWVYADIAGTLIP